jgi:hypothetical protein
VAGEGARGRVGPAADLRSGRQGTTAALDQGPAVQRRRPAAEEQGPYAVREGEQQALNFDVAHDALGALDRAGHDVSTRTGALDSSVTPGVRTVALGIAPDLIYQGVVDLKGYTVNSAEDQAKLAQVYCDSRFETFRFIDRE